MYNREIFIWWNKQTEPDDIFERLDREMATYECIGFLPNVGVSHLLPDKSDHVPIKIDYISRNGVHRRKKKQFRFEDIWIISPDCENIVRDADNSDGLWNSDDVLVKIKRYIITLEKWDREEFGKY